MARLRAVSALLMLIAFSPSFVFADQSEKDLHAIAIKYIDAIKGEEYRKAALLLYYPDNLVGGELEEERSSVEWTIALFTNEFGKINTYQAGKPGKYVSIFIMAGSVDVWSDKMSGINLRYLVDFDGVPGYLFFRYSEIDGNYELRTVEYGLPDDGISREKMYGIFEKIKDYQTRHSSEV